MRFWPIFDWFSIPPMAKNMQKQLVFVGQNKDACFYVMIALGTDSGSILAPKIRPNRPQEGSKVDQKSDRKTCWVWDRFWNDFWSFFGQNGGTFSRRSNLKNLKNPSLGLKMWLKPPGRVPRHSKYSKIMQKWREILYFFREKVISANCYCCHF